MRFSLRALAIALTLIPTAVFGQYTESVLATFGADFSDGALPTGSLAVDASRNFYGTLNSGGNNGYGTVYEASPTSSGYNVSILYRFSLTDGAAPAGGLIIDAAGNLYGTTSSGGDNFQGTVFELSPSSSGWTFKTLYFFTGSTDGGEPAGALVFDASGNLYGTTVGGGAFGNGTVFKLSPSSSGWTEEAIYSFTGGADGQYPSSTLVFDASGNLYGTANRGGSQSGSLCTLEGGCGTVFRLSPGTTWTFSALLTFQGNRGANPAGGVILDPAGNLYGCWNSRLRQHKGTNADTPLPGRSGRNFGQEAASALAAGEGGRQQRRWNTRLHKLPIYLLRIGFVARVRSSATANEQALIDGFWALQSTTENSDGSVGEKSPLHSLTPSRRF